jgi:hypothetical protein
MLESQLEEKKRAIYELEAGFWESNYTLAGESSEVLRRRIYSWYRA